MNIFNYKKIIIIFLAIVLVAGGFYVYRVKNKPSLPAENTNAPAEAQNFSGELSKETDPVKLMDEDLKNSVATGKDTDNDGIADEQELKVYYYNPKTKQTLRLDPKNPDTDGDGLKDGEEIFKYHTNPLNPDTDGDGYSDGQEVKGGYNPLGAGKLAQ